MLYASIWRHLIASCPVRQHPARYRSATPNPVGQAPKAAYREPLNRYTYVDIDPAIKAIAEKHFLREPARGEFIADDARRFVATSERRFDAVVVDVYSSHTSIPSHPATTVDNFMAAASPTMIDSRENNPMISPWR